MIFDNKVMFITGAGSIGSKLLEELLKYDINSVRIFDNSELKLHNLKQKYGNNHKIKYIFGDMRDKGRLSIAMRDVDIVFHTAAMKHVGFCENNPVDAVYTNVLGTQNLIDVCIAEECEKVINISTDKAVSPIGVMGATKLLTERLVANAERYKGKINTIFSSVRFGNVMNSSGSVITIFKNQIRNNVSITITDKDMTRFMMSMDDAVNLILKTVDISRGSEIFILKMPSLRIMDLLKAINPEYDSIEIIGKEHSEKLHEKLLTTEEIDIAYENDKLLVICNERHIDYYKSIGFSKVNWDEYTSNNNLLSIEEIREIL